MHLVGRQEFHRHNQSLLRAPTPVCVDMWRSLHHPLLSPDCLTPRCRPPWAAIFPCRLPMHCWELAELVMLLMRPFSLAPLSRPSQSPMLPGDAPCNSSFGINPETDSSEASLLSLDHRGSMLRPVVGCCIFKMAATARAKVWQVKTLSEGTG